MAQKEIHLQTQGLKSSSILVSKAVGWVSIDFDNIKINVDAYNGFPSFGYPRTDSLITIVTEKTVYEFTPEQLIAIIEFYCSLATQGKDVVTYRNRNHAILPDFYKNRQKAQKGLKL